MTTSLAHKIPMELVSKILLMRPIHPVAKIIKEMWDDCNNNDVDIIQEYIMECDTDISPEHFEAPYLDVDDSDYDEDEWDAFAHANTEYEQCMTKTFKSPVWLWIMYKTIAPAYYKTLVKRTNRFDAYDNKYSMELCVLRYVFIDRMCFYDNIELKPKNKYLKFMDGLWEYNYRNSCDAIKISTAKQDF